MNMKMKHTPLFLSLAALAFPVLPSSALEVEVERVDDTGLPWGYIDVSDFGVDEDPNRLARQNSLIWDHSRSLQLSEEPFVDYMVAFNSGVTGILAEKIDAPYLEASQSTVNTLTGGSNGALVPDPEDRATQDRYSSFELYGIEKFSAYASWNDGFPLPSATSWWGVSWGGGILFGDSKVTAEIEVRVNLASDGPVNVAHLFNDGWYYSSDLGGYYGGPPGWPDTPHPTLEGHEFTVTHHSADGSVVEEVQLILPSGGGTNVPGKANEYAAQFGVQPATTDVRPDGKYYLIDTHIQFYTGSITATRQAEGDYLILRNRGGNVGYRMTLVTLGNDRPWDEGSGDLVLNEWSWLDFSWVYGLTEEWGISTYMGYVYVPFLPYVYQVDLGWLFYASSSGDNHYFYSFDLNSYILINEGFGGYYYIYATDDYTSQIPQP